MLIADNFMGTGIKPNIELAYRWALYARFLGHPNAQHLVDYFGDNFSKEQKDAIEQDMPNWDPAQLPPTEYFFFDGSVLGSNEERKIVANRAGVSFCRN